MRSRYTHKTSYYGYQNLILDQRKINPKDRLIIFYFSNKYMRFICVYEICDRGYHEWTLY